MKDAEPDIYIIHRRAVETWREACQNVEFAEKQRDDARQALDNVSEELLASCAHSTDKPEKRARRRRTAKPEQQVFPARHGDTIVMVRPNGAAEHAE